MATARAAFILGSEKHSITSASSLLRAARLVKNGATKATSAPHSISFDAAAIRWGFEVLFDAGPAHIAFVIAAELSRGGGAGYQAPLCQVVSQITRWS